MINLRLLAVAAVCIMLSWPPTRAAAPAAVPRWADQVLYFATVDRFADGDAGTNVIVDRTARGGQL